VTEEDVVRMASQAEKQSIVVPLPDFITSARRELMESAVFLVFFGAIVKLQEYDCVPGM